MAFFQKTCLTPVTFLVARDGRAVSSVVVTDSFHVTTLDLSDL